MKTFDFHLDGELSAGVVDLRDPDVGGFVVTVKARKTTDGTWEVCGVSVESPEGPQPVTASTFREIGVGTLIRAALLDLHQRETHRDQFGTDPTQPSKVSMSTEADMWHLFAEAAARGRDGYAKDGKGRPTLDGWALPDVRETDRGDWALSETATAELRRFGPSSSQASWVVATAARFCESKGLPVTGGVATVLGLPYSTASHWLKLARQSGWVPASGRRSPGGR